MIGLNMIRSHHDTLFYAERRGNTDFLHKLKHDAYHLGVAKKSLVYSFPGERILAFELDINSQKLINIEDELTQLLVMTDQHVVSRIKDERDILFALKNEFDFKSFGLEKALYTLNEN
jgi:hypothetical protein